MSNLSPPPLREKDLTSQAWQKWFSAIQLLLAPVATGGLSLWSSVSKVGSNLTDLVTRNHSDLQNINSSTYSHLTSAQLTDLTDAGDSALHYHATDRTYADSTATTISNAAVATHVALANPHTQYLQTWAVPQYSTVGRPAYVKGFLYFDTTTNKLVVGGAVAYETITSV
jgi:hypothetical protein